MERTNRREIAAMAHEVPVEEVDADQVPQEEVEDTEPVSTTDDLPNEQDNTVLYPTGEKWDGEGNTRFKRRLYRAQRMNVHINRDEVDVRTEPFSNTGEVVETLERSSEIPVFGYTIGERVDGNDKWWVTEDYHYIWSGGTNENAL